MADPHVITALSAKRSEIERYIAETEKRVEQARADLAHVNASIRLFEVTRDETTQFPVYVRTNGLFRRGEMPALCEKALQAAPDGTLDTRQIARAVIVAKGWNAADKALVVSVTSKVVHTLDEASRRGGRFQRAGKRGGVNVWRVVD